MLKKFALCSLVVALAACNTEIKLGDNDLPEQLRFDFENGSQGWQAGFSDYDTELADGFELQSGVRTIPTTDKNGYYLSGKNQSDDLFMFIKSRFRGLQQSTRYVANISTDIYSNAGSNCIGIGGAPGESVFVKFGFAETEPQQAGYDLNVDKGNQSNSGTNANVIGNLATLDADCSGSTLGSKTLSTTSQTQLEFTTTAEGRIWLFIGTDSGFEGLSEVYFDNIEITVTIKN